MNEDQELLRAFAENKSQEAFAALVRRHLLMIYTAALRQVGDARAQGFLGTSLPFLRWLR